MIKNKLGYVFGGYTAVPWSSSDTSKSERTAFLFSLTNPANNPLKLKVIPTEKAVVHYSDWGPTFGGGADLHINSFDSGGMFFKSYESPNGLTGAKGGKYVLGGSTHFYKALEIEIFQVI